ncbi:MAG TPA: hypothetical protein PLQ88_13430 [Blastocatellia bacterium]|nr:hypothetical protein [Blastocatellia bacterium]
MHLTEKKKTYKFAFEAIFFGGRGFGYSWRVAGKADRLAVQHQNTETREEQIMSLPTMTIEVDRNSAQILLALKARAEAEGTSLSEFLRPLAETEVNSIEQPFYETATPEEWAKAFREWVASHAGRNYGFVDDSRESIYTREDEAL